MLVLVGVGVLMLILKQMPMLVRVGWWWRTTTSSLGTDTDGRLNLHPMSILSQLNPTPAYAG